MDPGPAASGPPDPAVVPVADHPAAVARLDGERAVVVADYHAGIEAALERERGISLDSHAERRRERLLELVDAEGADSVVVLGDLMHSIGGPGGAERAEVELLFEALDVPVTLVKGNHDGGVEEWVADLRGAADLTVTDPRGVRLGDVGFCHGHTWPATDVLDASVVCLGHEHPCVRLEDEVGGSRVERVWLRGKLAPKPFAGRGEDGDPSMVAADPALVVFPAFNERVGGTWVNLPGQSFLAPFLPEGLADGEAYLLDGTRLGPYGSI